MTSREPWERSTRIDVPFYVSPDKKWTPWYVLHERGRGTRIKVKPHENTVDVGSGSTSQWLTGLYEGNHEIEEREIQVTDSNSEKVNVIRFTPRWASKHDYLLRIEAFTLEEYEDWLKRLEETKFTGRESKLEEFF